MKYKTREKIQKWLDELIQENELKVIRDKDFSINIEDGIVTWGLLDNNYWVFKSFENLCKNKLDYPVRYDIMSFLHELGHYFTLDLLNNFQFYYSIKMKKLIFKLCKKFPRYYSKFNYLYQRLPDEKAATMFACDFANQLPEEIKKLEEILENE